MKLNKILVCCIIVLAIICLGCVNAADNYTTTYEITSQDSETIVSSQITQNEVLAKNSTIEESSYLEVGNDTDDFDVEVSNVFNGYENTIVVSCPNASGNVDIVVGEKTYISVFTDGRATQTISDYGVGINKVTVKCNNLTKETSFKVLDGIVTYENFYDYFDETNEYKFHEYIPNGVTLDFRGNITYITLNKTEDFNILSMNINKPVNIISTTNDAFIDFNGKAGSLLGEYQGSKFSITNGGSWSNVTGITIHNTQVWIYNTHHVTLDNISVLVEDARIGSGVGATSVRANSTWCTVKNSYFYTRNNGGSSSLVMAWADYCTFDNNTVVGEGNVGNLIYLTTYNVDFPIGVIPNCHNNITNNRMYGPSNSAAICWMLVISGQDTLLQNNTISYDGGGIMNQHVDNSWYGGDAVPMGNTYIGNKVYGGCEMHVSGNSIAYDNIVEGDVNLGSNVTFYNNIAKFVGSPSNCVIFNNTIETCDVIGLNIIIYDNIIDSLTIDANNVTVYGNQIGFGGIDGGINIQVNNSYFKNIYLGNACVNLTFNNNTVDGILYVFSNNNIIAGNRINSSKDYAIDLKKTTGNVVTGNYLISLKEFGDSAVLFANENVIKDNYPVAPDILINADLVNNFENIVTVTVPNATGSIIIQVSDKKYALTLENAVVVQRISGLDPGNYTLTVDYRDDESPIYSSNSTSISVPKIDTYDFQVTESEFMEGNIIIPVLLPSDADGKVIINDIFKENVINGECSFQLDLAEGEYDIDVKYANSQRYADKSISVHIKVIHNPNATLTVSNITTYSTTGKITAKLTNYNSTPIANATLTFSIGSRDSEVRTDENGVASSEFNLEVGTHKVSVSFNGNSNYTSTSSDVNVNVLSRFSDNKNIVMDYYDGSKYKVRIVGDDGKFVGANQIVKITINGKSTNVKTDKNGYASLTITNVPRKYTITATYKGQTVKNTVQVKQTLKASKITVKKTANSFNLKATLKTSKNKAIKNKKVTFKFNGKSYSTKTNSKGVAYVKIVKNVIKKLKKGKKYTFAVMYVSNSIKSQVTVK